MIKPPQAGGALADTGWCPPLRHPSHPRAWGWRAVQAGAWRRQLVKIFGVRKTTYTVTAAALELSGYTQWASINVKCCQRRAADPPQEAPDLRTWSAGPRPLPRGSCRSAPPP